MRLHSGAQIGFVDAGELVHQLPVAVQAEVGGHSYGHRYHQLLRKQPQQFYQRLATEGAVAVLWKK